MGPMVPTGRDARLAWQSLAPEDRQRAWAAAKKGSAPPDGALAAVMAGYGSVMYRRYRALPLVALGVFFVVMCGGLLILVQLGRPVSPWLEPVLGAAVIAVSFATISARQRYRRLASAGALGLQAAWAGAVPAGHPQVLPDQGEFTVPYGVPSNVPATAYAAPGVPGIVELRARRGRVVFSLSFLGFFLLCAAGGLSAELVLAFDHGDGGGVPLVAILGLAAAVLVILAFVALLVLSSWHVLREPITARFTPQGWELPSSGFGDSWSAVLALEVRALTVGGGYGAPVASPTRLVVFRVADPQRYLAQIGPVRRRLARRTVAKYGSPALIVAGPRAPIELEPLLATLAQYTAAPVHWT